MKYFQELKRSMEYLANKKNSIFIGQAVEYPGTAMYNTLIDIKKERKIELPVAEEMQMGITIGMAMNGMMPISIYPRWNFLLLATNQIVNHLDKIKILGKNKLKNKIIIRTSVGSQRPLHPQHQHVGNFTKPFAEMCPNVDFIILKDAKDIFSSYKKASESNKPTVLVEFGDYYNEK
jgi:pyruvate/2-oxoglutarate/acetoin dehydrogenase E1 component